MNNQHSGAYGIALSNKVFPAERLNPVPNWAEPWTVKLITLGHPPQQERSPQAFEDHAIAGASRLDDAAAYAELTGFNVSVDRATKTASIESHSEADPERLAHPCLSVIGAAVAHWNGCFSVHAGAVVVDGRAWGVLADRAHGKSTTMAALARAGFGIVTDDMLLVDPDLAAHAGPRCVDLRVSSAQLFPEAVEIPPQPYSADGRSRLRLTTVPIAATTPLAGFIRLEWSFDGNVGLHRVSTADRLAVIGHSSSLYTRPSNPRLVLDLASLPMFALERPKDLGSLDATIELIASLGSHA